ncbi:hypothetical protein FHX42_004065 [Saccharopolyspora lacisalsi]|uniref:Uncharacterized protein n=1 Tax=Halosaccharopolyspora lacisalsi TaxID=1000566 RepID=A0A839E297_9PSEU|nr:hypothetical protein [Halosaccharopolyspora lacisalsi]
MPAGIELYQQYGDDLTEEQFHQKATETANEIDALPQKGPNRSKKVNR